MTANRPLRGVLWAAVSTGAQVEDDKDSLPLQVEHGHAFAAANNIEIVAVLEVPGHSRRYLDINELAKHAREEGIDAFDKLIDLLQRKGFDVLIVRDSDRLARTQALQAYIVESIINMGSQIYSFADGWITETNYRMWVAMSGYKAAKDVDELVKKRRNAMRGVAARGLPTSYAPAMTHRVVRDPRSGKALSLELNPDTTRLMNDVAALLLERVGWNQMEHELYQRFGHVNPNTGRPFASRTMYAVVYHPSCWGATGRYYSTAPNGPWVYDDDVPPPAGVELYRHTVPPVWTGEQAALIKAELRRREGVVRGKAKPNTAHGFTGILLCDECGRHFTVRNSTYSLRDGSDWQRPYTYWRCGASTSKLTAPTCQQGTIRDDVVRAYVSDMIDTLLRTHDLSILRPTAPPDERPAVQAEIDALNARIDDMMAQRLASKVATIRERYTTLIDEAGGRLEILTAHLDRLNAQHPPLSDDKAAEITLRELETLGTVGLWELPQGRINQVLHALLGRQRLLVRDGQIVGLGTAPGRNYR